ncbi:hypothetical protein INS49_010935 [Diaporthe citri]|uniref:uncharacterized protein n=1 Tax=Diaporthe citri TaxID=83186 RepID=UPI001C80AB96|nr:uncharacterized protein INS49_010935 [Diaporthe citri]KAG6359882.1 hypothetical protein INS49_010935 [Diaporthe citri]
MNNVDSDGSGAGPEAFEHDPVVVCGMAMRLPGVVSNCQQFWDLLMEKRCGSVPVPRSRFNAEGYYSEQKRPGTFQLKQAYFMDHVDIDRFDTAHFPFSHKEVEQMDPVQRLLLEITWECLENAGETDWQGKTVGCYVGSFMEDWSAEIDRDTQNFSTYPAGKWDIMLANRISYAYDFHGPSMTIKTGCSATLVALNLAEQAVKSGECSSAIIAGCNIFLSAASATKASYGTLGNVLSPEGICKTFDADCNGYGRGEAINAVYIKRLSHALRDGNPIRAIIRSTATQHDGKKPGLLNPNTYAQEALIRHTYKLANITDYSATSFFECHGTGTPMGDPTEVSAVERIFGKKGILIGGVKPNTGHSEGAAALTSVIKVVLMLEHGIIAPNINFETPNPNIPWAEGRISVPTEAQPFPSHRRKRVSVNAFGIGGTNAHAILEAYEGNPDSGLGSPSSPEGPHLLLFSASNTKSLELLQDAYKQHIAEKKPNLVDLAYTLGCRRSQLSYRSFMIAHNGTQVSEPENRGLAANLKPRKTVFVFNGQGAQWPTMGKALLQANPTFLESIRRLDRALSRLPGPPSWTIEDEMSKEGNESRIMDSEFSVPCSTAVQIGITEVLRSWSILPDAVSGHSSGEIAGAFAAGALSAEAAIIAAYFRGKIPRSMGAERKGTMAAIGLGPQDVTKYLITGVIAACENSQSSTTISGDADAVESVMQKVKADGHFARLLTVDRAYHSPHMDVYGPAYEDAIRPFVKADAPQVLFFSSVTEDRITDAGSLGSEYWHKSLVQPVRFNGALRHLLQTYGQPTNPVIIEIGARPALKGPIKQILDDLPNINACHVPTLEQGGDCNESMLKAAGRLFCENVSFDRQVVTPPGRTLINVPTYPWAHEDVFQEEHRIFKAYRDCRYPMHDLLGRQNFETSALEPTWRKVLQVEDLPWVADHMINGQIIFPFAGYLSIAEEALRQYTGGVMESFSAKNFAVSAALQLEPGNPVEIHTRLRQLADASSCEVQITSWKNDVWTQHCRAVVSAGPFPHRPRLGIQKREFPRILSQKYWYNTVQDRGFYYGPAFRGLDNISVSPYSREATAKVHQMDDLAGYLIHPTALDQCFQTLVTAGCHGQHRKAKYVSMPSSVQDIFISRSNGPFWTTATSTSSGLGELSGSLLAYTDDGQEIMSMSGVQGSQIATQAATDDLPLFSNVHWDHHSSFYPFQEVHALPHSEDSLPTRRSKVLVDAFRVLSHTNPQLRILEIGTGADTTTRVLMENLRPGKGRQLFSKYTYAAKSLPAFERATKALEGVDGLEIGTLESGEHSLQMESSSYDVIISTDALLLSDDAQDELRHIKELLRPNALVILLELLHDDQSHRLLPAIRDAGFEMTSATIGELSTSPMLKLSGSTASQSVSIIVPTMESSLVDQFKSDLKSRNIKARTCSIDEKIPAEDILAFFLDLAAPHVYNLTEAEFRPFIELLSEHKRPIVWVTTPSQIACGDPRPSMILGLARTLRSETKADITVVEADVEAVHPAQLSRSLIRIVENLPHRHFYDAYNPDYELAITKDGIKVPRFQWTTPQQELSRCLARRVTGSFTKLIPKKPRHMDSLNWVNYPLESLHPGQIRVEVKAAAIHIEDVNAVKSVVDPSALVLGQEGAGVVIQVGADVQGFKVGDKVMFFSEGALASHLNISPEFCLRLDNSIPFELAASIPLAYTTAYLTVVDFGRIHEGAIVLLPFVQNHLCLALLQLLQAARAKVRNLPAIISIDMSHPVRAFRLNKSQVYTTIQSDGDRTLLENRFNLPAGRIFCTQSELYTRQVQDALESLRFDFVIGPTNTANGYLQYLSAAGTFLHISDIDAQDIAPPRLRASQAYRIINIRHLSLNEPELIGRALQGCNTDVFNYMQGLITTFDADQCREAFRAASQEIAAKNKITIRVPAQDQRDGFQMSPTATALRFRPDTFYLLIGGLGGLGRVVSTWMVENGARKLVFLSRSAKEGPQTSAFLNELRSQGCMVKTVAGSVANSDDVSRAVKAADAPIAGVIQMSMVLRDDAISRMSYTQWRECVDPKVEGTINLHKALLHEDLDFFLLFSSMSGVTGQIGQANYNAANVYLDSFVRYRHHLGLSASVIDIGVMGGVGVVAQTDNMELRAKAAGYYVLSEQDLLDSLTASIIHSQPPQEAGSGMSQMVLGLWSQRPLADPSTHVLWKRDARMSLAYSFDSQRRTAEGAPEEDEDSTIELIVKHLGNAMMDLLAQPGGEILPTDYLDDLGLDSLNAIELTGWIAQYFSVDFPLFELIHTPTLWDLAVKVSDLMYEEFAQDG